MYFPEAWSLSVEEWFYFLFPLLLFLLSYTFRLSKKNTVLTFIFLVIICTHLYRYAKFLYFTPDDFSFDLDFRKQVFTQIHSIVFGVLGAFLNFYYKNLWIKYKNISLLIGVFLLVGSKFVFTGNQESITFVLFFFSSISFGVLFLLPFLSQWKKNTGVFNQPITVISIISYSMYLINLSIVKIFLIDSVWKNFSNNTHYYFVFRYLSYWGITIVLSILLYKFFEFPIMKLRDKNYNFKN
jgi:peptidoglycan/LPS O-acetylase OafA/YrhL